MELMSRDIRHFFLRAAAPQVKLPSLEQATFSDSTKNWTPNQWAGYSIKATNTNSICYGLGSYIISNTSNTITYAHYTGTDVKFHLIFNNGDTYEIHRVLIQLDQNGRGKGDQITGRPRPVNTT